MFLGQNLKELLGLVDDIEQRHLAAEFNRSRAILSRPRPRRSSYRIAWDHLPQDPLTPEDCPSVDGRIKPIRARNVHGDWRVIVQDVGFISQQEHISVCLRPEEPCEQGAGFLPCLRPYCRQQTSVRRLLAYDPCNPRRAVFVDRFQLSSQCSCLLSTVPC